VQTVSATIAAALAIVVLPTANAASDLKSAIEPLFAASCMACHSNTALSPLDLSALEYDLADPQAFRTWAKVYGRLERGEMPPEGAPRATDEIVANALAALDEALTEANLAERRGQRTPLRRLTQLEYAYTLNDLLLLDDEIGHALASSLPAEADSGGFDTVAAKQGISALHVRSYLQAADRALDAAIKLGPRPKTSTFVIDYANSQYLKIMHDAEILGGGITKGLDDAAVMFFDTGSTYLMHSDSEGYKVPEPGYYRVTIEAYGYQANTPVTLTVYRGIKQGVTASLDELIGSFDLIGDEPRTVSMTTYLTPGQLISPSVADLDVPPGVYPNEFFQPDKNIRNYAGEGIAIKTMTIEGPLIEQWPPASTRALLGGVDFDDAGQIKLTKSASEHVEDIVARFGALALRRPLDEGEVEDFARLAQPLLADERPFLDAVRVPLRAILSSPSFLYQPAAPGLLDDFSLATRLSYFLWRSMPDEALFEVAGEGRLSDPVVLARQVERMLADPKAERFIKDFAGQAYRLYELKATSPDPGLYPEYDDRLGQAMQLETELFLSELIAENLTIDHLIDADFTFLNRRLAEHYEVANVEGQTMRKVALSTDSPRGGLIAQASVHKITANGTTTSPVPRGNFVLANVLGKPAPPPPPNVSGLEPDTRGTTTIREQLDAHRKSPICAGCHRKIDPPGFALEVFDPIGGFRKHYRVPGGEQKYGEYIVPLPYRQGLPVDASGITPEGRTFGGLGDYQRLLLDHELDQVARNMVSQLVVLGTGADIGFADREAVEEILVAIADDRYPIKSMIKEVVASDLFRRQ
jgi:hypothetical protein